MKKEESSTGGQSRNSSAGSSNKSSKSTKSTRFELDDPTPGIDSNNLESSNAKSEQLANALEYLKLGLDLTNTMEVEDHLREKRFALNQMWALFSALHHCVSVLLYLHSVPLSTYSIANLREVRNDRGSRQIRRECG